MVIAALGLSFGAQAQGQAIDVFKATCFASPLEDFDATVSKAEADGWKPVASESGSPTADALLKNYGNRERYRDHRVLASAQAGEQFTLSLVAGLPRQMGETLTPAMNICQLIDHTATGPVDKGSFDSQFDPLAVEKYQAYVTIRQVFYASPDAPPAGAFYAERPNSEIGLKGLVFTASQFAGDAQ